MRPQDKISYLVQGKTGVEDMMKKINELIMAHNGDNHIPTTAEIAKQAEEELKKEKEAVEKLKQEAKDKKKSNM